jgi:DNA polymerase III subunit delta'
MSFLDIYGHERQIAILKNAIAQKRVGHAYLFSGINAIGKRTLALQFAQALNCQEQQTIHDACGLCSSCLKMQHSSHPDLIMIEAQGQFIRIESIREIQEQMKFKPLEGGWRTVIIDDADKLNDPAANALLKTLEEPTTGNILILVSSRPYSMPATVISRCRHMRFNPLTAATVARFLVERRDMDEQQAALLAGLSGGSVGKALEQDEEGVIIRRGQIIQLLMEAVSPAGRLKLASFFGQDKKEIKQCLDVLNSIFRDTLIFKETGKCAMLINQDKSSFIAELARRLDGGQLINNISQVARTWETIELNVNKTLTLETMAFKLIL